MNDAEKNINAFLGALTYKHYLGIIFGFFNLSGSLPPVRPHNKNTKQPKRLPNNTFCLEDYWRTRRSEY